MFPFHASENLEKVVLEVRLSGPNGHRLQVLGWLCLKVLQRVHGHEIGPKANVVEDINSKWSLGLITI